MKTSLRRLIQKLRRLGVTVEKSPRGIRITPRSKVPPADLARLTEAREVVRALLDDEDDDRATDRIPPRDYRSVGLERFRGKWTHPLGDEHAAQILSGAIPIAEARQSETLRRRRLRRLGRGQINWRYPS